MPKPAPKSVTIHNCWILLADDKPVGVYLNKERAVIERLRYSRDESTKPREQQIHFALSEELPLFS